MTVVLTPDQIKRLQRLRLRHSPFAVRHQYSRFVRLMKLLLPSLAAILLALVVIWPRLRVDESRFRVGFADIGAKEVEKLSMVNARFFGIDQQGHPFTVTSVRAEEEDKDTNIVDLEAPKADFASRDGSGVFVTAERGYYRQKEQLLDLQGDVSLYHEKGYELHTEQAHVDLAANTAHGEVAVHGQGPQGRLEGEGFELRDKGSDVIVTGKSTLTLRGASPSEGAGK